MSWEDELAGDIDQQADQRAAAIAGFKALRDQKIDELWALIDAVVARANSRISPGRPRFYTELGASPQSKSVVFDQRRLRFEVEALRYDTVRHEPAFLPGGLARVYVDLMAPDLSSLFCAMTPGGAEWRVMPSGRPVTDETIGLILRTLVR